MPNDINNKNSTMGDAKQQRDAAKKGVKSTAGKGTERINIHENRGGNKGGNSQNK